MAIGMFLGAGERASAFEIASGTPETLELAEHFQLYANTERQQLLGVEELALDTTKLVTNIESEIQIIFINEGAGYRNQLQFIAKALSGEPLFPSEILFDDISGTDTILSNGPNAPLSVGDYIDLGRFEADVQFDFQLIGNGANGGSNVFGADADRNPDGIPHLTAYYELIDNVEWVVLAFEDTFGGGDRDYNDAVFAVNIPLGFDGNPPGASAVPEPSTIAGLILFSIAAGGTRALRRR